MADFLTRLAERTLSAAPVVQPLIAPRFTPEPIANPPDSGWNDEVRSSGDLGDAAPPADTPTGQYERTVVEHPGVRVDVAPDDPDPGEDEVGVASPPGARTSPAPRPRPAEDVPEREEEIIPSIRHPRGAYEPEARASVKPIAETRPDLDAPDELRSTEIAVDAARAGASPQVRSVIDARGSWSEQKAPEAGAWAARVEPAERMLATRDTAGGRREEAAKTRPGGLEGSLPADPGRAARATEVATVIPARPAVRPGRSDEATARPATPPASSDPSDLSSHASGRTAVRERRPGPPPRVIPDERATGPEASPSVSAAPDATLMKPTMGPSDAYPEGGPWRQPQPEPSPPIVRVNIGRVEVRAMTTPPPRQQAAKPARLSLDDYLRSRSGGGRR